MVDLKDAITYQTNMSPSNKKGMVKRKVKAKKVKYIKFKSLDEVSATIILQNWVLEVTNAGLISISLNRHVRKFLKGLKEIPLSEELQGV